MLIINAYRHPGQRTPTAAFVSLLNLLTLHKSALLVGDLNAHHASWGDGKTDSTGTALLKVIDDLDLLILNDRLPTLLTPPPAPCLQ